MKRLLQIAFILVLSISFSCEGPEGPVGPQGEPGPEGQRGPAGEDAQRASILEFSGWTFTEEENYVLGLGFEDYDITVEESDVILVYRLFDFYEDENGQPVGIWSPLPQSLFLEQGTLQYTMYHTYRELILTVRAAFDLATLTEEQRQGFLEEQIFRIIIVPGEYLADARIIGGKTTFADLSYKDAIKKFKIFDENPAKYTIK